MAGADDPGGSAPALIAQARVSHQRTVGGHGYCRAGCGDWPCLTARLADALEQVIQPPSVTLDAKVNQTIFDLAQKLDAANARAERLAGELAQAEQNYRQWYEIARSEEARAEQAEQNLKNYGFHRLSCEYLDASKLPVGTRRCSCGLSAALGLAGPEEEVDRG